MNPEQLKQIPLFKDVAPTDLQALIKLMKQGSYPAGAILFEAGSVGDSMYIILSGRIRIYVEDEGGHQLTLTYHEAGQVFGELSLLDQRPRSAAAAVEVALSVLILQRLDFLAFLNERPQVGLVMMQGLAAIVRSSNQYLDRIIDWGNRLARGDYDQIIHEASSSQAEEEIQELLGAFLEMAQNIKARHEALRQRQ